MCWKRFVKALSNSPVRDISKVLYSSLTTSYRKHNQNSDIKHSMEFLPKNNQGGRNLLTIGRYDLSSDKSLNIGVGSFDQNQIDAINVEYINPNSRSIINANIVGYDRVNKRKYAARGSFENPRILVDGELNSDSFNVSVNDKKGQKKLSI